MLTFIASLESEIGRARRSLEASDNPKARRSARLTLRRLYAKRHLLAPFFHSEETR